jgi:hypothetical protein
MLHGVSSWSSQSHRNSEIVPQKESSKRGPFVVYFVVLPSEIRTIARDNSRVIGGDLNTRSRLASAGLSFGSGRRVLHYNGITNVTIHDAKSVAMKDLPRPFDLLYGFYTIGFHWSLEHFFDEVLALIGKTGIAVFTVQQDFQPFDRLLQLPYRLIEKGRMIDKHREKLLILGPCSEMKAHTIL